MENNYENLKNLTEEDWFEIRLLAEEGASSEHLMNLYNITKDELQQILELGDTLAEAGYRINKSLYPIRMELGKLLQKLI